MPQNLHINIPKNIGPIHFCGIGGIGMSGIAEILNNLGYTVQGSDIINNANTERLARLGVKIFENQLAENVVNCAVVVKSSAIKDDNPEIKHARELRISVIRRAEMLREICRLKRTIGIAGSHGKTTTTSLIAHMLSNNKYDPTVINGGVINSYKTNAYLGSGEFLVAETDESDGSFCDVPCEIAIVTNIDPEHMDHYKDFEDLKCHFRQFVESIPFYGFAVICLDNKNSREIAETVVDRRIITYSLTDKKADISAYNIKAEGFASKFDVKIAPHLGEQYKNIKNVAIPMPGIHNVQNALAAIAVAIGLGSDIDGIKRGFEGFEGVKRRFSKLVEAKGVMVIEDYAHHPEEIKATLNTAKQVTASTGGKIIAFFQMHRYSRARDLKSEFAKCFNGANLVRIMDVYAASETPIAGINKYSIADSIKKENPSQDIAALENDEEIMQLVQARANKGDLVLFMGAGSITKTANDFAYKYAKEASEEASA